MSADRSKGSSLSSLSGLAALSSSRSSQASISARRGSSGLLSCPVIIGSWRKDQDGRTMRGEKKAKEVMLALVRTGSLSLGLTHTHVRSFPRFLSLSLRFLKLATSSNTLNGSACSLSFFSFFLMVLWLLLLVVALKSSCGWQKFEKILVKNAPLVK